MEPTFRLLGLLPLIDWLAVGVFFGAWTAYSAWARRRARTRPTILAVTNRWRREWMLQSTWRDNRIIDSAVVQNLSTGASFFASTTILIIGGLLAVLSTTEKATELVREIPFAARTSELVFDLKLVLLLAVFVYAFFRFTWSLRQYTFGAILVAAAPEAQQFAGEEARREAFADRAGRVMGLAAESFNDGLRAYYLSFAGVCWFFSPWAMMTGTVVVIAVLYQREFRSEVLGALSEGAPGHAGGTLDRSQ